MPRFLLSFRATIMVVMALFVTIGWKNNNSLAASSIEAQPRQKKKQQQASEASKPQQQTKQGGEPQQLVIPLTSKSFDRLVSDGNVWLIEFYAPWCTHCQSFAGTYEEVAYHLQQAKVRSSTSTTKQQRKKGIQVAKVNTASERALATRFAISALPSFYVVDGWSVYEFRGYRSLQGLVEFAKGGYLQTEPVPFLMSPMGPMGQLQGCLVTVGYTAMDVFYLLQRVTGLSATFLSIVACVIGISLTFFSIIVFALFLTPKSKVD